MTDLVCADDLIPGQLYTPDFTRKLWTRPGCEDKHWIGYLLRDTVFMVLQVKQRIGWSFETHGSETVAYIEIITCEPESRLGWISHTQGVLFRPETNKFIFSSTCAIMCI